MKRFSSMTTTQIARICGVSQGTVDRALHGRPGIKPETRERILSVAREYAYVPSVNGRQPSGKSMLIGVVLYDLYNEFFSKLAMSLTETFQRVGYSVVFLFSDKELAAERSALDYFNYIGVDGIILFSVGSDDAEYLSYLRSIMRPMVVVGNRLGDLTYIGVDDERAMYDLTVRMLEQNEHGETVYFAPILNRNLHSVNAQRLRFAGFCRAAEERGRVWRLVTDEESLSADAAAIICSTDYYVLRVLKKFGFFCRIPIAGFDHVSALENIGKAIMTVDYSTDLIAEECMHYLLKRNFEPCIPHTVWDGEI
ncbi:MAG: LacI family DNA-binding transcriptional regulator [Clostridia bacterium]|nr:LacI family DNA-binding transcriptional regulator [Clostridia bacterium]